MIGLVFALAIFLRPPWEQNREKRKAEEEVERVPRKPAFWKDAGLGVLLVATNPTSLAAYFAMSEAAVHADIVMSRHFLVMASAGVLYVTPILWPLLAAMAAPRSAARVLGVINDWLMSYGLVIAVVIILYLGAGLLWKGLVELG